MCMLFLALLLASDTMGDKFHCREGNSPELCCLAMIYTKNGELQTATRVLSNAMSNGFMVNIDCFSIFIEGLYAKGKISEAENHAQMLLQRSPATRLHDYQKALYKLKCKYLKQKL